MTTTVGKVLLMLVAALIATIVAIITVWLTSSTGAPIQSCLLYGGGAFGGTMTLIVLVLDKTGTLS